MKCMLMINLFFIFIKNRLKCSAFICEKNLRHPRENYSCAAIPLHEIATVFKRFGAGIKRNRPIWRWTCLPALIFRKLYITRWLLSITNVRINYIVVTNYSIVFATAIHCLWRIRKRYYTRAWGADANLPLIKAGRYTALIHKGKVDITTRLKLVIIPIDICNRWH